MMHSTRSTRRLIALSPLMLIALCCMLPTLGGCADYGTKLEFNGSEVYYTTNVTEADAKKLGDFLVKEQIFEGEKKSVQLDKAGETYHVRLIATDEAMETEEVHVFAKAIASRLKAEVFNAPTEVHLSDGSFKSRKSYSSESPA